MAKKRIVIDPFNPVHVQPSSYDITLDNKFRFFKSLHQACIDVRDPGIQDITELVEITKEEGIIMHPGEFMLGSTVEYIKIPNDLVSMVEGRSSLGRLGLIIHSTAGYIDPGFEGRITLEMLNISKIPLKIYPDMRIGQISFYTMTTPAEVPYGDPRLKSKYQGQSEPTASKLFKDFE